MVVTWSLCEQMLRGQPASCAGNGRENSLTSFQHRARYDLRLTRSERLVLGGIHHELFGLPGARFVWRTILHLAAPHRSLLALTTAVVQLMLPSDQCRLGQRRRADRLVSELPAHVSRLTVSDPRLGCGRHCAPCHPSPNRLTTKRLKTIAMLDAACWLSYHAFFRSGCRSEGLVCGVDGYGRTRRGGAG
jgi:hypothetical protein